VAKTGVDLFEGGQQPFAPLAVQARDAGAQLDRLFQIVLFGLQRVVFLCTALASSSARRLTAPSASRWRFRRWASVSSAGGGHGFASGSSLQRSSSAPGASPVSS
jgi:hypothetical protein